MGPTDSTGLPVPGWEGGWSSSGSKTPMQSFPYAGGVPLEFSGPQTSGLSVVTVNTLAESCTISLLPPPTLLKVLGEPHRLPGIYLHLVEQLTNLSLFG